jgi:hypothetical protein
MATMARRGLTPILVLLVVVPPRLCACDHDHELTPLSCEADPATEDDRHHHHDPDCPCLKPAQLPPATLAAAVAAPPPPALHLTLALPTDAGPAGDAPAPVARRTGDPPLYLTHCNLRF